MTGASAHRLEGLEPDNLLAFLALLGLLRALETADETSSLDDRLLPRVSWDEPPLRPVLHVRRPVTEEEIALRVADAIRRLAQDHDFTMGQKGLVNLYTYPKSEARKLAIEVSSTSRVWSRYRADLLAALMSDAACTVKDKVVVVSPNPVCVLNGTGHQYFLQRLKEIPEQTFRERNTRRKADVVRSPEDYIAETLFNPWRRGDNTDSFRWDPDEIARHAMMAGDPTDNRFKLGTQHGANLLASVGISVLTSAPRTRGRSVQLRVIGVEYDSTGNVTFAWPIWQGGAASLAAIKAMLAHPGLRVGALRHLGVEQVMVTHLVQTSTYYTQFVRALPL